MFEAFLGVPAAVMALIVASVPVHKLLGWWLDGGVEGGLALISILLYFALITTVIACPSPFTIVILVVIVISAFLMPVLGQVADQAELRRMEDARFRNVSDALERNPMDPGARLALADSLHRRGDLDQAIENLAWTIEQFPRLALIHKTRLDSWRREKERQTEPQPIICHSCHSEQPALSDMCGECGAMFGTRSGIEQRVWREGGPKVVIRGWIVTGMVLLVAAFLVFNAPIEIAGPIVLASVLVGAWVFLRWVGGSLGAPEA